MPNLGQHKTRRSPIFEILIIKGGGVPYGPVLRGSPYDPVLKECFFRVVFFLENLSHFNIQDYDILTKRIFVDKNVQTIFSPKIHILGGCPCKKNAEMLFAHVSEKNNTFVRKKNIFLFDFFISAKNVIEVLNFFCTLGCFLKL